MQSIKGRFFRTNILMVIISAVLVLFVSLLLLFVFSVSERNGFLIIINGFEEVFHKDLGRDNTLIIYLVFWAFLVGGLILLTCVLLSFNLSRSVLKPIKELQKAAINIIEGNLDFEILACEDLEINKLCQSFDQIRKKLKETADQQYRNKEERNMLMANLSHDMRTPVTTIKGYIEGIKDGVADTPEKQSRYLDTIYNKALILEKLLDNMAEYSELELGRMQFSFEYVNITSYLKDVVEDYKRDIELVGLDFEYKFLEQQLFVVADCSKLKRVLDNLISNAIKYNKQNGSIFMSTQTDGKGVLICISDTGNGISSENINKVFDGFYRGDASRSNIKGNGLGLSIAKEIIGRHRGKIWMKSEENVGTEVFIYLPLRVREDT
ncbi:sensor histidine kinase [Anaerovorax odorimutans]|uniref:sensor histidine kinase n=1 Tax=Anaerovorax odorimutans TaxID=109327 RepID=UPI0003FCD021|nr:HAMP domain-containing sensor histidine kinase [Anaerovorax odorimutans]